MAKTGVGHIIINKNMKVVLLFFLLLVTEIGFSQHIISIESENNDDNSVDFKYTKTKSGTYYLHFNFTNYENTLTPQRKFTIKSYNGVLMKLKPISDNANIRYSYTYTYTRGLPNPKIDTSFVYILPFKNNITVEIRYLSYLKSKYFGKEEPKTWKSFQFISNKPDTVCSIRKGIVVNVVDKYAIDTTNTYSYSSERNSIMIEHPDGTFANYEGLDSEGIFVKEGDMVYPNQPLAKLIRYDKNKSYQLRLTIDYLTVGYLANNEKVEKCSYEYIDPYFQTTNGITKLAAGSKYTAKVTEDLIVKELSKKELKNRLKTSKEITPTR